MERKPGQTSLEFMYAVGVVLLVFTMSALLFYRSQEDAAAIGGYLESQLACQQVAGMISAVASSGDGTSAYMQLPLVSGGLEYSVFVSAANRTVSVAHRGRGVGCRMTTSNVSNGSSGSFYVGNHSMVRNVDGGVLVE